MRKVILHDNESASLYVDRREVFRGPVLTVLGIEREIRWREENADASILHLPDGNLFSFPATEGDYLRELFFIEQYRGYYCLGACFEESNGNVYWTLVTHNPKRPGDVISLDSDELSEIVAEYHGDIDSILEDW